MEEAEEELIETLKSVKRVEWEISEILRISSCLTEDPITYKLASLIKDVTGKTGQYGTMGSGDLCSIASEWGAKLLD